MATTYLLNSPILTDYGLWRLEGPLSVEETNNVLNGGFESSIGHAGSAEFLSLLLGIPVEVKRQTIQMQPGDQAIVFRLLERLPEGAILSKTDLEKYPNELGLLSRVE